MKADDYPSGEGSESAAVAQADAIGGGDAAARPTATAGDIYVYLRVMASSQALLRHPLT